MIKDVYKIDDNSNYVDVFKINTENNDYYDGKKWLEIDFDYIEIQPPHARIVKWENNTWVIIEEYPIEPQQPQIPTTDERVEALEMAMLDLVLGGAE